MLDAEGKCRLFVMQSIMPGQFYNNKAVSVITLSPARPGRYVPHASLPAYVHPYPLFDR